MNCSVSSPDTILLNLVTSNVTSTPGRQNWSYRNYTEFKIALALNQYSLVVLCPISVLFNSAAILTISRLKPFNTSSLYVILLAIFDSLTMIAKLTNIEMTRNDADMGHGGCKVMAYVGSFLDQFSIWILVLLTLERFVAVWLPLKVSSWFTMFRARLGVAVTALCLALINLQLLFTIRQQEIDDDRDCRPHEEYMAFFNSAWYWIESCISGIFPCILLTILNILIVYRMRAAMQKQRQMISGSDTPGPSKNSHKAHLTVMLVTVSVAFVLMVMPLAIFNTFRGNFTKAILHDRARYILTSEITHFLADCNHVFNFLFYFVSSRRFRRMFYMTLRCKGPLQIYGGASRTFYLKSTNSTTNTYYMHTSMRTNGGVN